MDNKIITKKQHYVPQVYLRGFSQDRKRIWSYLIDPLDRGQLLAIESQCRENYLYEIKDNDGKLLSPNWLEKYFSVLERMYASFLKELEKKTFNKENYRTKHFLTKQEKDFLKVFVAVQMMRDPMVLQETNNVIKEFSNGLLTENQIRAIAVSQCLPFFETLKQEDKNIFSIFLKPLLNMSTVIGVDEKGSIFTSDNPVYCYSSQADNILQVEEYEKIVFPLTSNLVLLMLGGEMAQGYDRNRLFSLDQDAEESVKLSIAYAARTRVYSKSKLIQQDREIIKQAREDKSKDEIEKEG